jgi:hypothetical protein
LIGIIAGNHFQAEACRRTQGVKKKDVRYIDTVKQAQEPYAEIWLTGTLSASEGVGWSLLRIVRESARARGATVDIKFL